MTDIGILEKFGEWTSRLPEDAEALRKAFEAGETPRPSRELLIGGLAYLLRKIDIVPDYLGGLGSVDDVLVMRIAAFLAVKNGLGDLEEETASKVKALSTDQGAIKTYLEELYDGFESYVEALPGQAVRGRNASQVIDDPDTRQQFLYELNDEIKNYVAKPIENGERALRELKSFIKAKLKK